MDKKLVQISDIPWGAIFANLVVIIMFIVFSILGANIEFYMTMVYVILAFVWILLLISFRYKRFTLYEDRLVVNYPFGLFRSSIVLETSEIKYVYYNYSFSKGGPYPLKIYLNNGAKIYSFKTKNISGILNIIKHMIDLNIVVDVKKP